MDSDEYEFIDDPNDWDFIQERPPTDRTSSHIPADSSYVQIESHNPPEKNHTHRRHLYLPPSLDSETESDTDSEPYHDYPNDFNLEELGSEVDSDSDSNFHLVSPLSATTYSSTREEPVMVPRTLRKRFFEPVLVANPAPGSACRECGKHREHEDLKSKDKLEKRVHFKGILHIQSNIGDVYPVLCQLSDTVMSLKCQFQKHWKFDPRNQSFVFGDDVLKDEKTLEDYGIDFDSVVTLKYPRKFLPAALRSGQPDPENMEFSDNFVSLLAIVPVFSCIWLLTTSVMYSALPD